MEKSLISFFAKKHEVEETLSLASESKKNNGPKAIANDGAHLAEVDRSHRTSLKIDSDDHVLS